MQGPGDGYGAVGLHEAAILLGDQLPVGASRDAEPRELAVGCWPNGQRWPDLFRAP